ncbi:MAG: hypothetical protein IPJ34_13480 [Myxococcales bacterium]|nr:hypothetical protein [Myxococcales bacterium]
MFKPNLRMRPRKYGDQLVAKMANARLAKSTRRGADAALSAGQHVGCYLALMGQADTLASDSLGDPYALRATRVSLYDLASICAMQASMALAATDSAAAEIAVRTSLEAMETANAIDPDPTRRLVMSYAHMGLLT